MTQPPPPHFAPCGCRVWPGDGYRPDTLEINPICMRHGGRKPGPAGNAPALVPLLIVFAILAGLYVAFHAYKYSGCLITPGLFDWPKACI